MTAEQRPASAPDELVAYARAELQHSLNSLYALAALLTAVGFMLPMAAFLTLGNDYPPAHRIIHLSASGALFAVGVWSYRRPRLIGQHPLPALALLLIFNVAVFATLQTLPAPESLWSVCYLLIGTALLYPHYLLLGLTVAVQAGGLVWAIGQSELAYNTWSAALVQFGATLLLCGLITAYQRKSTGQFMRARASSLHAQQQLSDQMHAATTLQEQSHSNRQLAALGRFGGGLLHDFNNILMPIMGNASILRDSELDSSQKQRLDDILTAVERASQLSRQVRALLGPPGIRHEQIDLTTTVSDLVQSIWRTLPTGASVELEPFAEPLMLRGNQAQLQRALTGLLIGLVERYQALPPDEASAADPEPVSHSDSRFRLVLAHHVQSQEASLQIIVSTPSGNTPVDSTERLAANLEYAQNALQELGGRLEFMDGQSHRWQKLAELSSESDARPTEINGYLIVLPLTLTSVSGEQLRVNVASTAPDTTTAKQHSARSAPNADAPLVLVVDDEPALREITASMLAKAGYRCAAAASGNMAVEFCKATRPAVVIMDMRMPGLPGREAARQIRQLHPELPILICTGYDSQPLDWIDRQGGMTLLTKPFNAEDLVAAVSELLVSA